MDEEAIFGVELSAHGEAVLNLIREIASTADEGMSRVAKGAGFTSNFSQPSVSPEQRDSFQTWMKEQTRQLQGLYRSNLTGSGERLKAGGPVRMNIAGREAAESLIKLFGGPTGFFGLNPKDIEGFRKTFEKALSAKDEGGKALFSTSARQQLRQGFSSILDEVAKSPTGKAGAAAAESTQAMAAEIFTTLKLISQSPALLGMLRNVSQARLDVGTVTAQEQLVSPEGEPFYQLRKEAARSRRIISSGTEAGGLNLLTSDDVNELGANKAVSLVAHNLIQASAIYQSLGKKMEDLDVETTTLARSMQVLNAAEAEQAAVIRAAKTEQLGRGSAWQRFFHGTRHYGPTSTVVPAEEQSLGQFAKRHAANTLGYLIPGIAFGMGLEELSKTVEQAMEAQRTLAEVKAEFDALGQGSALGGYIQSIQGVSSSTGVAIDQTAEFALQLKGVFGNTGQAEEALKSLDEGIQATGESGEELLGQLTAISQAFDQLRGMGGGSFTAIQNQALHFQDVFGVPAAQILAGTSAIGPIAQQLGFSDKFTQALVAATVQKTDLSGADVGEAMMRILPGFTTNVGPLAQQLLPLGAKANPVLNALNSGNDQAAYLAFIQLLGHISAPLGNQLITTLGGNPSSRGVLISQGRAVTSGGFEQKLNSRVPPDRLNIAFQDVMQTLQGSMSRLGTTVDNLAVDLVDSGLGRTMVDIVNDGTTLVRWLQEANQATGGLVTGLLEFGAAFVAIRTALTFGKGLLGTIGVLKGGGPLISSATQAGNILVTAAEKAGAALQAGGEKGALGEETGGLVNGAETGLLARGASAAMEFVNPTLMIGTATLLANNVISNYIQEHPKSTWARFLNSFSDSSIEGAIEHPSRLLPGLKRVYNDVNNPLNSAVHDVGHFFSQWFNGNLFAPGLPRPKPEGVMGQSPLMQQQDLIYTLFGGANIPLGNVLNTHELTQSQVSKMDAVYGPKITQTLVQMESDFKSGQFKVVVDLTKSINTSLSQRSAKQDSERQADVVKGALDHLLHSGATPAGALPLTGPINLSRIQGMDFTAAQTAFAEGDVSLGKLLQEAQAQKEAAVIQYNNAVRNQSGPGVFNQAAETLASSVAAVQQIHDQVQQELTGLASSLLQPGSPASARAGISLYSAAAAGTSNRSQKQQFVEQMVAEAGQLLANEQAGATSTSQSNAIAQAGYTFKKQMSDQILAAFASDFDVVNSKGKIVRRGTEAQARAYLEASGATITKDGRIHVPGQAIQAPQQIQAATEVTQAMMQVAISQAWANPIQALNETETYTKELMQQYLANHGKATDPAYLAYKAQMAQAQGQGWFTAHQSLEQAALGVQTAQAWAEPLKQVQETTAATQAFLTSLLQRPGVNANSLPVLQLKETLAQQPQAKWQAIQSSLQAKGALQTAQAFEDPVKEAQIQSANLLQQMLAYLKIPGTSKNDANYVNLQAQYVTAQHQKFDAAKQVQEAQDAYLAQVFSPDPIKAAEENIQQANVQIQAAHGKAARWQAMQNKVQALQQYFQAQTDELQAAGQVQQAAANVAGQPYQEALAAQSNAMAVYNQRIAQDKELAKKAGLTQAQTTQLIKQDTTATSDWANVLNSKASAAQSLVSQTEDVLEAQLTLGQITVTQAISNLWAIYYKVKNNEQERYAVLTEIRQLQNSAGGDLSFNLPTTLIPTTLYQARLREATGGGAAMVNGNVTINMNFANSNGSSATAAAGRVAKIFGYTGNITGPARQL